MFFKDQLIGKYKVIDTVGSGGFGSVYLAIDTMIDKRVAIKVPHKQGEELDKLLREPKMLAALDHPHIVNVLTAERQNGIFFIIMEYVEGASLEQILRKDKVLDVDQALVWFRQICDAIGYAHSRKVIHRDLRPANVLISRDGKVKVADLGTSRFLKDAPFASTRIGSPPYMAPEHFKGKTTFQSDIYSMGVMMYECLTGTLPYYDPSPQRMALLAREGKCKPPHRYRPDLPVDLSHVVLRAMHSHLSGRYPSFEELDDDLSEVQENPIPPVPPAAPARHYDPPPAAPSRPSGNTQRYVDRDSGELSRLFCWNCRKPISKRAQVCPHCNVQQA